MFRPYVVCHQCGSRILLRSFRLPGRTCPHCGQIRDPDDHRDTIESWTLLLTVLVGMVIGGGLGAAIGYGASAVVDDSRLPVLFGLIGVFDGVGIGGHVAMRLTRGTSFPGRGDQVVAVLVFVYVGAGFADAAFADHSFAEKLVVGVINALAASLVSAIALRGLSRVSRFTA